MFDIGDTVKIEFAKSPPAERSTGWNLEGSVAQIKEVHKDRFNTPYYFLSPIDLKIKDRDLFSCDNLSAWWRDEHLVHYSIKEYDIDPMVLFEEE